MKDMPADLLRLASTNQWEAFLNGTKDNCKRNVLACLSIFSKLISMKSEVPDEVMDKFVNMNCPALALQRNEEDGSTPLHLAIIGGISVTSIRILVEAHPLSVNFQDVYYQTPLDTLSQKIVMSEERRKYACGGSYSDLHEKQDPLWECARLMLSALCYLSGKCPLLEGHRTSMPLLHAVVVAGTKCPESLRRRAFSRYSFELNFKDSNGNFPIHLCASIMPDSQEDSEIDDLYELIDKGPQTLLVKNLGGKVPLQIAKESGRTWNTGLSALLKANPESLESFQLQLALYPHILTKVSNDANLIFHILCNKPTLFAF
mmetsp:Transcript_12344/g.18966  ORF Transcript_12344/g.18966 Transcript_12344/m.18966 type:complete len:317 (-) Transcript_12344:160-1110(-)